MFIKAVLNDAIYKSPLSDSLDNSWVLLMELKWTKTLVEAFRVTYDLVSTDVHN